MNELMETSLAPSRFSAELVGVFAVLALLLASVGIYGLLAYLFGQHSQEDRRTNHFGARRGHILKLILILYGIQVIDLLVFLVVPAILLMVSFAASYIPTRRAARISPMLREGKFT